MDGWIKIHRKIIDNPLYLSEPFTRMQAWIDLILVANHKEGYFYIRGNRINVGRGQVGISSERLADRWKWSRGKVTRYLNDLEKEGQIIQQKSKLTSLISIVNYSLYQSDSTTDGSSNRSTDETSDKATVKSTDEHQTEQQTDINKNDKKEKKSCSSDELPRETSQPHPPEAINYDQLVGFFNNTTKGVFGLVRLPLSETRKSMIRARIREHGKETFADAIRRATESDFLKGNNNRCFKATFDWLIKPTNYEKLISGNYDNQQQRSDPHRLSTIPSEDLALSVAAGIARADFEKQGRDS